MPLAKPSTGLPRRTSPLKKNLIILGIVALAEILLLSFNARLDTTAWRATRWLLGDQQPYNWQVVRLNPKTAPAPRMALKITAIPFQRAGS